MTVLADRFDLLLLDLDGTVYLGHTPIEHVAESLGVAAEHGARSVYITNNASRPPTEVAAQLTGMGLQLKQQDVLTSPQAAAELLIERHPAGAAVLVVGAPALVDEVRRAGLRPVRLFSDNPVAVVQGHSPDTGWHNLAEACLALRAGADWVAANVDSTLPTDRGLLPGNGAMVAALVAATGLSPRVAGKPARALIDTAVHRFAAERPLVVGDRLDTDIAAGVAADVPALLVFTGVSTPADLLAAPPTQRPEYLAFDLRGLVDDARFAQIGADDDTGWTTDSADGATVLSRTGDVGDTDDADTLRALATLCLACWSGSPVTVKAEGDAAVAALQRLGLGSPATVG